MAFMTDAASAGLSPLLNKNGLAFCFRNSGIEEVYVLSGHLGDKIEQRYGKEKDGMKFHYLRAVQSKINEGIVVNI